MEFVTLSGSGVANGSGDPLSTVCDARENGRAFHRGPVAGKLSGGNTGNGSSFSMGTEGVLSSYVGGASGTSFSRCRSSSANRLIMRWFR